MLLTHLAHLHRTPLACNTHPHLLLHRASAQPQKRLQSAGASQSRKRGRTVKGNCCVCQGVDASLLSPESRGLLQEAVQRHAHTTLTVAPDITEVAEQLQGAGLLYKHQRCVDNFKRRLSPDSEIDESPPDRTRRRRSVGGLLLEGELRVLGATGHTLRTGKLSPVCVRRMPYQRLFRALALWHSMV